jgi:titin
LHLELLEDRQLLSTFTVTNTNDAGSGSLRQAILDSNRHSGGNVIHFNIKPAGPYVIYPLSPLPSITKPVDIDGRSQPGFVHGGDPMISLDGSFAGPADGLDITSGNSTVRLLNIRDFNGQGIAIYDGGNDTVLGCQIGTNRGGTLAMPNSLSGIAIVSSFNHIGQAGADGGCVISGNMGAGVFVANPSSNNIFEGNYIGLNYLGNVAIPNQQDGIIFDHSSNNTVGGITPDQGNLISGNYGVGVTIRGGSGNYVENNRIGVDSSGRFALGNLYGVYLNLGASYNYIGWSVSNLAAGNLISGNRFDGVTITDAGSNGNTLWGNYIGNNFDGTAAIPNGQNGVSIVNGASGNSIGFGGLFLRNTIAGNIGAGVAIVGADANFVGGDYIGTDWSGNVAVPNGAGVYVAGGSNNNSVGNIYAGNVISGNTGNGVDILGPSTWGNSVFNNHIGTNAAGTAALSNANGVHVAQGAYDNDIGAETFGSGNVISGNQAEGVWLTDTNTRNNFLAGNYIGVNYLGNAAVPNGEAGVWIDNGATDNLIGGLMRVDANAISGNGYFGVVIRGNGTERNEVWGNFIGTEPYGTYSVANGDGVWIAGGASNNGIGGESAGSGNIVSGNWWHGVAITDPGTEGNAVEGNYIGLNYNGTARLPNAQSGVWIGNGASRNYIGNGGASGVNVISGNNAYGVAISDSGTSDNQVERNYIGTDPTGTVPEINGNSGVAVINGASGDSVLSNVIAFNGGSGVQVGASPQDLCINNFILANAIFENLGLGIDLGNDGVTPNQAVGTPGPNNYQSSPVLGLAFGDGHSTIVTGTLQSIPDTTFYLQVFVNTSLDGTGFGQGEQFVTSLEVTTDDTGLAAFATSFEGGAPGEFVTATATDPNLNTSEFSAGVQIAADSTALAAPGVGLAGAMSQLEASRSISPSSLPSAAQSLAAGLPAQANEVPLGTPVSDRMAVDAFFGGAVSSESRTVLPQKLTPLVPSASDWLSVEQGVVSSGNPVTKG